MKALFSWLRGRYFLGNACQGRLYAVFNDRRILRAIGKIDEGNGQTALFFGQHAQQLVLVDAIGFAYLAFHTVAFHRALETAF